MFADSAGGAAGRVPVAHPDEYHPPRGVPLTAQALANAVGGGVVGDASRTVTGVAGLAEAGPDDLSFLLDARHVALFESTHAGIVFAENVENLPPRAGGPTVIYVPHPLIAFARAADLLGLLRVPVRGVHPTALLGANAHFGSRVTIGPYAVLGEGVRVGERSYIGAGAVVGDGVRIGSDCRVGERVVILSGTELGDRAVVHPGAVLGGEGFGFVRDGDAHRKIPQVGRLVIEDDVEIGANTTVDRGTSAETRIAKGTKIDNLVHVGHNVRIGENCLVAGQSGIAGSAVLESDVTLAGQVGVADHIRVGRGVIAGGQAGLTGDIPPGEMVSGYPALPHALARRVYALRKRLPELFRRLQALEREVRRADGRA
jgi:UDP-3-O-[3-hydroxymyristoyl] glucosamine N-acyltransferase